MELMGVLGGGGVSDEAGADETGGEDAGDDAAGVVSCDDAGGESAPVEPVGPVAGRPACAPLVHADNTSPSPRAATVPRGLTSSPSARNSQPRTSDRNARVPTSTTPDGGTTFTPAADPTRNLGAPCGHGGV